MTSSRLGVSKRVSISRAAFLVHFETILRPIIKPVIHVWGGCFSFYHHVKHTANENSLSYTIQLFFMNILNKYLTINIGRRSLELSRFFCLEIMYTILFLTSIPHKMPINKNFTRFSKTEDYSEPLYKELFYKRTFLSKILSDPDLK